MIRKSDILLVFLLFITGCHYSSEKASLQSIDNAYKVDVVSCIEHKQKIKISDIAYEISYIPLETNVNILLRNIQKISITENFIFVSDENGLYQFTAGGKYCQRIGNKGRGPGEYTSILNFAVNEKANTILVVGEYSTNEYDLEGNYIKKISKPPGIQFEFLDKDRIVFYRANNIESPANLIITSLDLKPEFIFYNFHPKPKTNYGLFEAPLYNFKDRIYFKEHWNDTLFYIQDSVLVPHIIFNEKELLLENSFELKSTKTISDLTSQLERVEDKLMTQSIFEGERFVFISYRQGMNPRSERYVRFLFDKKNNNMFCVNSGEFTNDIDGGIDFYPQLIADSNILIQWIDANKFKAFIASKEFMIFPPTDSLKKFELMKINSNLKENDNPVLMLVKLKE